MRLVDADAILKADENSDKALVLGNGKSLEIAYALLKKKVEDAPTVDAEVVVRCKDCYQSVVIGDVLYCTYWGKDTDENGYCHEGG